MPDGLGSGSNSGWVGTREGSTFGFSAEEPRCGAGVAMAVGAGGMLSVAGGTDDVGCRGGNIATMSKKINPKMMLCRLARARS